MRKFCTMYAACCKACSSNNCAQKKFMGGVKQKSTSNFVVLHVLRALHVAKRNVRCILQNLQQQQHKRSSSWTSIFLTWQSCACTWGAFKWTDIPEAATAAACRCTLSTEAPLLRTPAEAK